MLSTDLVSELRAEVTQWWDAIQQAHRQRQKQYEAEAKASTSSVLTPILGAMLGEGPIRMITLGQELTVDMDEKSLAELMFKDNQMVYVSISANRLPRGKSGEGTAASYLPAPCRDNIPHLLLLRQPASDQLFSLLQLLSNFKCDTASDKQLQFRLQSKARSMSRKVWDLLMLLPTSPSILQGFKAINQPPPPVTASSCDVSASAATLIDWSSLLDPLSPHKLMYSLQVVESLSRPPPKHRRRKKALFRSGSESGSSSSSLSPPSHAECEAGGDQDEPAPEEVWSRHFVLKGGLTHLFSIFMSGTLQTKHEDSHWNEVSI